MKKITAVLLALLTLLTWTAACAESVGTRVFLDDIEVSLIGSDNKEEADLHNAELTVTIGSPEGMPTLQIMLRYGDEQETECIFQLVDDQLVMCFGGISGTYYIDLESAFDEPGKGKLIAGSVGSVLAMFAANPDVLLQMALPANKRGTHVAEFELPKELYLPVVERVLDMAADAEMLPVEEIEALRESYINNEEPVEVEWRYRRKKNGMMLRLQQGEKGIKIQSDAEQTTEPMEFADISADEMKIDMLNMDEETKDELFTELEFFAIKIDAFLRHSSLRKLL